MLLLGAEVAFAFPNPEFAGREMGVGGLCTPGRGAGGFLPGGEAGAGGNAHKAFCPVRLPGPPPPPGGEMGFCFCENVAIGPRHCQEAQGFRTSRPLDADRLAEFINGYSPQIHAAEEKIA